MVAAETKDGRVVRARGAHPEEWFSILVALGATVATVGFFWLQPTFQPAGGFAWTIPGWIAFAYLFSQIMFLLVSATQIRALGVLDSIVSIFPFVAGLVMIAEWVLGRLPFSLYQLNALAFVLATGLAEFLLTVWIRFVVNRRTIAIDAS
jgi:hypothetical protein